MRIRDILHTFGALSMALQGLAYDIEYKEIKTLK